MPKKEKRYFFSPFFLKHSIMTKRKILIYFVVVFIMMIQSSAYAQNTITKVAYKEYFDTDRPIQRSAYLYTDGKTSIYEQDLKSAEPLRKRETDENTVTVLPNIKYNAQIKTDHTQKQTYFFRSEEHTSELQSRPHLVCRLLLEKKKKQHKAAIFPQLPRAHNERLARSVVHCDIGSTTTIDRLFVVTDNVQFRRRSLDLL